MDALRRYLLSKVIKSLGVHLYLFVLDKMFNLSDIIREGSIQLGNREEFFYAETCSRCPFQQTNAKVKKIGIIQVVNTMQMAKCKIS